MEGSMPVETYVNTAVTEAPVQVDGVAPVDIPTIPMIHGTFQQALGEQHAAQGTPEVNNDEISPEGPHGFLRRQSFPASNYKSRTGPSFCQVAGCGVSLENHKDYHQRYKVCEAHLKVDYIERDGQRVRFCQQCGRFQPLEEFDDNKRSCRARLERHNARRRKRPKDEGDLAGAVHRGNGLGPGPRRSSDGRGLLGLSSLPLQPRDLLAMQEALHFASTTLLQASQNGGAKSLAIPPLPGQENAHLAHLQSLSAQLGGGKEGEGAGGGAQSAPLPGTMGTMPFVPTPEILLLLLRGYANMFHYDLEDAQIRPRLPPSNLPPPPQMPTMDAVQVAVDPAQMQQLLHLQQLQQAQQQAGVVLQGEAGAQHDGDAAAQAAQVAAAHQQYSEHVQHAQHHQQAQQQYDHYAVNHEAVQQQYAAAVQHQQEQAAAAAAASAGQGQGSSREGAQHSAGLTSEQIQAAALAAMQQGPGGEGGAEARGSGGPVDGAAGGDGAGPGTPGEDPGAAPASGAAAAAAAASGAPSSASLMMTLPLMMAANMPHLAAAAGEQQGGEGTQAGGGDPAAAAAQLSADALLMHQYLLQTQALQLAHMDSQQGGQQGMDGMGVASGQAMAAVQQIMAQLDPQQITHQHHEAASHQMASSAPYTASAAEGTPGEGLHQQQ